MIDQLEAPAVQAAQLRVMLVDDEDDYHLITRMMLKKAGFTGTFTSFIDPAEALLFLKEADQAPDLLLVDINMPATDGFQFLAECAAGRLIACDDATTVVMCSSSNRPVDMERASRTNCIREYIEKPLTMEQFNRIAHEHATRIQAKGQA
ncbi:MAG TPA: response regulator [Flavobacteriales bacterium]|nr:response regulator [Flavobacteriales bacterium]HRN36564.1 response regulator [Flavobacteriales bacterium]HRO40829.1 response regulator [Flavobacteriales bacterium]HRP81940.1 response regulator [Flavobacteriales bacterium]HRQ84374.1 response regulator [Flavobacteriales bacterium]